MADQKLPKKKKKENKLGLPMKGAQTPWHLAYYILGPSELGCYDNYSKNTTLVIRHDNGTGHLKLPLFSLRQRYMF